MDRTLLKTKEVAQLLGFSSEWVMRLTRTGEIPHVGLGRCVRYEPEEIKAYIASRREGGKYN